MTQRPVILLTDIGSDIDDALALQIFGFSPRFRLASVIVTHGELETRAKIARKMLDNLGLVDVPVALGAERSVWGTTNPEIQLTLSDPFTTGFEAVGLTKEEREAPLKERIDGVDLLVDQIRRLSPIIVSIAPMTTLALALEKEAGIINKVEYLYILGGTIDGGSEHNFNRDIGATQRVLASGIPTTIFPVDLADHVPREWITYLEDSENQRMIAVMAKAWKFWQDWSQFNSSEIHEKKRLYESFFRLGVIPGGRFEEHQRNIIERGLDMCRLGLARPDIDQQTKERLKEEQELIELLLSLNFIAKPESWLEDPDDALITLAIQLSEVISRDREVNRLFRNAWLKTMGTTIDTYDAHMPYIMENPKGARYKQGKFEIDGSGVVRLNEGEEHRIVTGFDVNDYRRFLRKRLTFDSTRKGRREIERRLRRAW